MAKFKKICKVCGKEYTACLTEKAPNTGDRWQDVACCIEHASEYFSKVYAARNGSVVETVAEIATAENEPATDVPVEVAEETSDEAIVQKKTRKKKQTDEADF